MCERLIANLGGNPGHGASPSSATDVHPCRGGGGWGGSPSPPRGAPVPRTSTQPSRAQAAPPATAATRRAGCMGAGWCPPLPPSATYARRGRKLPAEPGAAGALPPPLCRHAAPNHPRLPPGLSDKAPPRSSRERVGIIGRGCPPTCPSPQRMNPGWPSPAPPQALEGMALPGSSGEEWRQSRGSCPPYVPAPAA